MAQRALTPGNAAYCSECGAETLPDAAACARCGKSFEGSIEAVLCPICNSINPAGSTECVNCNARFPEPGSLTAVRTSAEPAASSPEEEYLRRILQLSREPPKHDAKPGSSPSRKPTCEQAASWTSRSGSSPSPSTGCSTGGSGASNRWTR